MGCIICNSSTKYFFTKEFSPPYSSMIPSMDFEKCTNCGFTFSPTIYTMDEKDFAKLNTQFHEFIENGENQQFRRQPPYFNQSLFLNILMKNGIIKNEKGLDFAGGYGTLSNLLKKYFGKDLFKIYDPYMQDPRNNTYVPDEELSKYNMVFSSAFFEHIRDRHILDKINDCVDEDGVLILHTVVCETIPKDPNWFYLRPVHSSFHTNKSMTILMKQWGYKWSLYCPDAKSWILFKSFMNKELEEKIKLINSESQSEYLLYNNNGFVDYWKGF